LRPNILVKLRKTPVLNKLASFEYKYRDKQITVGRLGKQPYRLPNIYRKAITDVGLNEASPYMDAPRLQEQSFDDDDTESIAAIHSVSNAAVV
jgi:hypothetical protein